mmetsp:Transcript_51125/g.119766  ORF Transcript_51125/g.119766 Transcript_51125/m.119766 type:complete len:94 (-) Transcript_51125:731-1012(-)
MRTLKVSQDRGIEAFGWCRGSLVPACWMFLKVWDSAGHAEHCTPAGEQIVLCAGNRMLAGVPGLQALSQALHHGCAWWATGMATSSACSDSGK